MISAVPTFAGTGVTFRKYGDGPPLLLVHGAFSNEVTNWEFVLPQLREKFTVYAIARRGRNGFGPEPDRTIELEARDVLAVAAEIPEPPFLLGHSYGAHCALAAAALAPGAFRKLVLYEPPSTSVTTPEMFQVLEELGAREAWDEFAATFFQEVLHVPAAEIAALRSSPLWPPIVEDSPASLVDLRSVARYEFAPDRFRGIDLPVLLQVGSESPADLYVTGDLFNVFPNARVEVLAGQAHEGMTTAPDLYVRSVIGFLLGPDALDS